MVGGSRAAVTRARDHWIPSPAALRATPIDAAWGLTELARRMLQALEELEELEGESGV